MDRSFSNTLFIYVLKKTILSFSLFIVLISSVLVFISFIQYADIFITTGISFSNILMVVFLLFPLSLEFALPLSLIATLMYVFYVMGVKNEILAIELTGLSRFKLAYPFVFFAFIAFIVNLLLSFIVFPQALRYIKVMAIEFVGTNIRDSFTPNRINDDIPDTVIFFREKENNDRYKGLYIFQKNGDSSNIFVFAKYADIEFGKDGYFIDVKMESGRIVDTTNSLRQITFNKGNLTIDISDLIEKKVKNIRGFYGTAANNNPYVGMFDGLYLSLVNIWIAVLMVIIFLNQSQVSIFLRYLIFFLLVGFYYVGFRIYHYISESSFMEVWESFISVILVMILFLFIFSSKVFNNR